MANLKSLRNRIASVKSTQKITKAMKMVAAAKLRRAREQAEAARPYAERMGRIMGSLASNLRGQDNAPLLLKGTGDDKRHLLVVLTSNKGLCGPFNSSIIKASVKRIDWLRAQGKDVKLLCFGRKGHEYFRSHYPKLMLGRLEADQQRTLSYEVAQSVAQEILHRFEAGEYDVATIVFNTFKSAVAREVTFQQVVPLPAEEGEVKPGDALATYEYEPDEEAILMDLLPRNVGVQVFRGLLENAASEQGARMSAMDSATRNAGEMIKKLNLDYNRSRQAAITTEMIEIVSGAESV